MGEKGASVMTGEQPTGLGVHSLVGGMAVTDHFGQDRSKSLINLEAEISNKILANQMYKKNSAP